MIEVLLPGLYTTIQDKGRFGYRKYGVPVSGPMDRYSAITANHLIHNSDVPVLEFVQKGPKLLFHQSTIISITGANFSPLLNQKKVLLFRPIHVQPGDLLEIGNCTKGMYGYLAVAGGFNSEKKLGSCAQYNGITHKNCVQKKEQLLINSANDFSKKTNTFKIRIPNFNEPKIVVDKGPEFDLLSHHLQQELTTSSLSISHDINRMGYRLNPTLSSGAKEIITSPVQPGTVQFTPSGQLIVLMRDAQTTGGYARVLQLKEESINLLSQKRPGEKIQFVISP